MAKMVEEKPLTIEDLMQCAIYELDGVEIPSCGKSGASLPTTRPSAMPAHPTRNMMIIAPQGVPSSGLKALFSTPIPWESLGDCIVEHEVRKYFAYRRNHELSHGIEHDLIRAIISSLNSGLALNEVLELLEPLYGNVRPLMMHVWKSISLWADGNAPDRANMARNIRWR